MANKTAAAKALAKKTAAPKKAAAKAPAAKKTPVEPVASKGTIGISVSGDPVQTITVAFTPKNGPVETIEKELQHGDKINDYRVVIALVGSSHTGVIGGEHVIAETPGASFA